MKERSFYLLIVCAIFSQVIGTFLKEKIEKTSIPRVHHNYGINQIPNEERLLRLREVPYIVNIQKNGHFNCVGSVLTDEVILTAAHCFREENAAYDILIGSMYVDGRIRHNITYKIIYPHFNPRTLEDDLALLLIYPKINLIQSYLREIELYNGNLPVNAHGTLSGWARVQGNIYSERGELLRSITVPIISLRECQLHYRNVTRITNKEICTLDRWGGKFSSIGDSGGPLIVDGRLVGIFSWSGENHRRENPDVFVNLSHSLYRKWILMNIRVNLGLF